MMARNSQVRISCLCLGLAQAPQIWVLESDRAIQEFRNDLRRSPSKTWASGELDCDEQVPKPTSCTRCWSCSEGDGGWVEKCLMSMRKSFSRVRTRSKAMRRHSLSHANQFIICTYDLQGKKLWMVLTLDVILSDNEHALIPRACSSRNKITIASLTL